MDCIDPRATGQRARHLFHAILATIEHDDCNVRGHAAQELLIIRDSGVNEDNLRPRLARVIGRNGVKQFLRLILCRSWLSTTFCGHRRFGLFLRDLLLIDFRRRGCGGCIKHEAEFEREQGCFDPGGARGLLSRLRPVILLWRCAFFCPSMCRPLLVLQYPVRSSSTYSVQRWRSA